MSALNLGLPVRIHWPRLHEIVSTIVKFHWHQNETNEQTTDEANKKNNSKLAGYVDPVVVFDVHDSRSGVVVLPVGIAIIRWFWFCADTSEQEQAIYDWPDSIASSLAARWAKKSSILLLLRHHVPHHSIVHIIHAHAHLVVTHSIHVVHVVHVLVHLLQTVVQLARSVRSIQVIVAIIPTVGIV